jgi:cell pole-organizing protein PopZ
VVQTFAQDDTPALEIDEETLRQMVVDIVRQELQGALGERITRNVRKLVRREIHRMLISQDFD